MDRREALTRLGLAVAALGAAGAGAACGDGSRTAAAGARAWTEPPGPLGPLGLQLYTLRAGMQLDMERTLDRVVDMGFREVEFAGYFGYPPRQVRAALSRTGLAAPSALVSIDDLVEDWFSTVQAAAEIGHRWLVVAWLPPEMRGTLDAWRLTAELFNRAADEAAGAGIRLAYHNRDFEFLPMEGRIPLEVLLEETDPALVDLALDVYWMVAAGADPLELFQRWPGRTPILHLNDRAPDGRMVEVGAGVIDWPVILAERFGAGVEHLFVDHEEVVDPYATAQASFDYLNHLDV